MALVRFLGLSCWRGLSSCFHFNEKARGRSLVSSFTAQYSSLVNSVTNDLATESTHETHSIFPGISLGDSDDGTLLFVNVLGINYGSDFFRQSDLLR